MAEDPAEVERLILSLYQPNPPEVIAQTQATLSRLQGTPEAWGLARILLEKPDQQVKFFGALTIVIKLNNESSSLSPEDASELLLLLINHYLDTLRSRSSPLVARKLASALATFFINFHQLWSRFIRHLIFCLVSGQSCLPNALDEVPDTVSLMERMEPSQAQAALWVLTNVFDEVAKINLNSVQNIGIYGSILENSSDAVALMSRSMSPQTTTEEAHEDAIRCLQSWVWFAQKSSSKDTRLSEPIGPLITAVITSLTVDELYSVSVELMESNLPKTNMTPEFKREWQVLRMRGILDPKHQKKNLRASAPEYSQVGEIIAGPTEFFSARLTRKERKNTLLEEVTRDLDSHKFTDKYAGIQKQKTSGKKAFYKNVVAQRRKRN
ncbi:rRNA-processing protein fcf2 [Fusarium odoratissimum]|uniref:rRNA-processing protein fcf2 n=1 Tax=Fusarium oxysporum f. sp. cubense (strain race 4) TaxID=2502994 RepID=N1RVH8_FUSC4|nr:rRNA-processing protein fcf2 [Fusarium odoratissimum]